MHILDDPEMKEIVLNFKNESLELIGELEEILEDLDEEMKASELERFGQVIDRIMGAAKSIGLKDIGTYTELGKIISYKASQTDNDQLLNVVLATLFDATDIIKKMLMNIYSPENESDKVKVEAFTKRLNWLSAKFNDIERCSIAITQPNDETFKTKKANK